MLQTLFAIKAFSLIFRANFYCQSSLSIQSENQIKFLQSLGNHLFMGTQSKPFKVFKVVSTQEPNLPCFFSNKNYGWHTRTAEVSLMPFWYVFSMSFVASSFFAWWQKQMRWVFDVLFLPLRAWSWLGTLQPWSLLDQVENHDTQPKGVLGHFATACLKQQYYIRTNLSGTSNSISLVFPLYNYAFSPVGLHFYVLRASLFFLFFCSLHFSHISKHIKNHPSSKPTKIVTHNILL